MLIAWARGGQLGRRGQVITRGPGSTQLAAKADKTRCPLALPTPACIGVPPGLSGHPGVPSRVRHHRGHARAHPRRACRRRAVCAAQP